jgi:Tfp pilus assembly major pilin PilA
MAPVQRAIVSANLSKWAKSAEDHSVKGNAGKKRADKSGSTAKAGGLRDNMYR